MASRVELGQPVFGLDVRLLALVVVFVCRVDTWARVGFRSMGVGACTLCACCLNVSELAPWSHLYIYIYIYIFVYIYIYTCISYNKEGGVW